MMSCFEKAVPGSLGRENPSLQAALQKKKMQALEKAIDAILDEELTAFLAYRPYGRSKNTNSRNGTYSRIFKTPYGDLHLRIPRDRNGKFTSQLLPKFARVYSEETKSLVNLFEEGMKDEEIALLFQSLCKDAYDKDRTAALGRFALREIRLYHHNINNLYNV